MTAISSNKKVCVGCPVLRLCSKHGRVRELTTLAQARLACLNAWATRVCEWWVQLYSQTSECRSTRRSPWRALPEQPGYNNKPKSFILRMLVNNFLCYINDTRAVIGLCLLVMSLWGMLDSRPLDRHVFTIVNMVLIGLSLHIHCFIHLTLKEGKKNIWLLSPNPP